MIGRLPTTLEIGGTEYSIRTDFRDALTILEALGDPELDDKQKLFVMLFDLYEDFEDIPQDDYEEAVKKANWFLNGGQESEPGVDVPGLLHGSTRRCVLAGNESATEKGKRQETREMGAGVLEEQQAALCSRAETVAGR